MTDIQPLLTKEEKTERRTQQRRARVHERETIACDLLYEAYCVLSKKECLIVAPRAHWFERMDATAEANGFLERGLASSFLREGRSLRFLERSSWLKKHWFDVRSKTADKYDVPIVHIPFEGFRYGTNGEWEEELSFQRAQATGKVNSHNHRASVARALELDKNAPGLSIGLLDAPPEED